MRTRGAIIRKAPGTYEVVDLELDDPRPGEVRVRMVAAGLCHSDDHLATGDLPAGIYPFAGGHEGAGVVVEAPPNHKGIREGDHVVLSFVPACGRCRWCAVGKSNFCTLAANTLRGSRFDDADDFRVHLADTGDPVGQMAGISTFCEETVVSVDSVITIDDDLPMTSMCLLSCGVGTGWGSAVHDAGIEPGDTVIVMGIGGVGIHAVQGARHKGATTIIAVDPVAWKRDKARTVGATHGAADMAEAAEIARAASDGQGADAAIVTVGVTGPEHVGEALVAVRKAGTCVVTGVGDMTRTGADIVLGQLTLYGKRLQGTLFGSSAANADIARQIRLYRAGVLELDSMVTTTYPLDEIARGYSDMHAGTNIRGVVVFGEGNR